MPAGAIVAPGAGGSADQPIVKAMVARLSAEGIAALPITFSRASRSRDLASEMEDVRRARDLMLKEGLQQIALVGRSFGGRVCTRLAAREPAAALIVLGHPISPPNRP